MTQTEEEMIEELSSIEHDQWINWSKSVAEGIAKLIELVDEDKLSSEDLEFIETQKARLARWESYWIPYDDLAEETKEQDREYARKSMEIFKKNK